MTAAVSVIVPVYNVQPYLSRCVDSILQQSMADFELILIDDGSTDGSGALCDAYNRNDRIRVIHQENQGLGLARNTGLAHAQGEYVCFVDADDYVGPELLEHLLTAAQRHQADLVIGGWTDIYADGRIKRHIYPETLFVTEDERRACILGSVAAPPESRKEVFWNVAAWAKLYRRELLERNSLRFVSERVLISEDILFNLDFFGCAERVAATQDASYCYCVNAGSLSKRYRADRFERNLEMYEAVRQRLLPMCSEQRFQQRLDRFLLSKARYCITQEVLYHDQVDKTSDLHGNVRAMLENKTLRSVLARYPWRRMPLPQGLFTFLMKRRLCLPMLWLVRWKQRYLGRNQAMKSIRTSDINTCSGAKSGCRRSGNAL